MCKRAVCLLGLFLILGSATCVRAKLVAHWKLDEKAGTTARDSSGNGYNGTLLGGANVDRGRGQGHPGSAGQRAG